MTVKSPLKWVGSKARLLPQLLPHLPTGSRLVEPFAGSCTVMMNTDFDEYLIGDVNHDLVNLYKAMAYSTDELLAEIEVLFRAGSIGNLETRAIFYYAVREGFNQSDKSYGAKGVQAAAKFLYLNRHGFNGMCRYNRQGLLNVPYGKYAKPYQPEKEITAFADKAQRATFIAAHYSETLDLVRDGDVVYCDPPYLTESANFTAYHSQGFNAMDHGRLARRLRRLRRFRRLAGRGISVVVSNSDLNAVHSLYAGFDCVRIKAPRSVGGAAKSQKVADELIIKSLPAGTK